MSIRSPKHQLHQLHPLHHLAPLQEPLHLPQHQEVPTGWPRVPKVLQSLLAMQVFILLTPPILFALYNLMYMLTGMQTQVPLLI